MLIANKIYMFISGGNTVTSDPQQSLPAFGCVSYLTIKFNH
jgi:hypothetical protein